MKALIETKSNYRNLNGKWVKIKQFLGTQVACEIETEEHGTITSDFNLSEIKSIKQDYESN